MSDKTIWDKLQNVDRRVFYWILFVSLAVPFMFPLGLPVAVTPPTQGLYSGLRKLQAGDVVALSINSGVSAWGDCLPAMVASVTQVLRQDAKLVIWSIGYVDCDITYREIVNRVPEFKSKTYGVDWVYFGYCPGQESNVALLRDNIRGLYTKDIQGTPTGDIPMMKNINGAKDIAMVLTSDTGDVQVYYRNQWGPTKSSRDNFGAVKYPVAEIGIAMNLSGDMSFFLSGDLFGLTGGSRGGAEMEKLVGIKGDGTITMDSINVSHLLVIGAIILTNVGYLLTRGKKR